MSSNEGQLDHAGKLFDERMKTKADTRRFMRGGLITQATEALDREDNRLAPGSCAYDDAILEVLLSHVSRSILMSTMEQAKSIKEISKESKIPLSTCYEKVAELLVMGVLRCARIIITQTGKRYSLYRAAVRAVYVEFGQGGLDVAVTVANKDGIDRSHSITELCDATPGGTEAGTRTVVRRRRLCTARSDRILKFEDRLGYLYGVRAASLEEGS